MNRRSFFKGLFGILAVGPQAAKSIYAASRQVGKPQFLNFRGYEQMGKTITSTAGCNFLRRKLREESFLSKILPPSSISTGHDQTLVS